MKNKWIIFMAAVFTMAALTLGGCGTEKNSGDAGQEAQKDQETETGADAGADAGIEAETETETDKDSGSEDTVFKNLKTTDIEGNDVDSSIFTENKLTLVNVWGTWCTPCVQEIPELAKISKDYEGKGVAIKGLIHEMEVGLSEEAKADAEDILEKAEADYQQLTVSEEVYTALAGLQAFPTTYFVDSQGNILQKIEGSNNYDGWKQAIEECLEKMEAQ